MSNTVTKENKSTVRELLAKRMESNKSRSFTFEKIVPVVLFLLASVSILTTVGIIFTLIFETFEFFRRVPFIDFITGTEWYPFFEADAKFGIWPLFAGTMLVTVISLIVALPIGLGIAIYLSEYASERARRTLKPILEVLAGIPTIVYG
ncbi:MAG: PstC family ABC transporter permease, partial [Bacilli bacterium]